MQANKIVPTQSVGGSFNAFADNSRSSDAGQFGLTAGIHAFVNPGEQAKQANLDETHSDWARGMDKDQDGEFETEPASEGQAPLATLNVADYLPHFKPAKSELLQRWFRGGALSVKGEEQEQMKDELLAFVQGDDRRGEVHSSKDEPLQGNGPFDVECEAKGEQGEKPGCKEEMDGERSSRAPPWTKVRKQTRDSPCWESSCTLNEEDTVVTKEVILL